jgi:hypothetical protein
MRGLKKLPKWVSDAKFLADMEELSVEDGDPVHNVVRTIMHDGLMELGEMIASYRYRVTEDELTCLKRAFAFYGLGKQQEGGTDR